MLGHEESRLPYRIVAFGLPALLAIAPLPFGGRTPAASSFLCAAAFLLSVPTLFAGSRSSGGQEAQEIPCAAPLSLFLALVCLQIVPLPEGAVAALNPATAALRERVSLGAPWGPAPLSVSPAATLAAIGRLSAALAIFTSACFLARRREGIRAIAKGLCLAGLIQSAYGLVDVLTGLRASGHASEYTGRLTGTFINPNHFAALLELALPAAVGLSLSIEESPAARPRARRRRVGGRLAEALSDPSNGRKRLLGVCIGVMSAALLFSLSRAGILLASAACLGTALLGGKPAGGSSRQSRGTQHSPGGIAKRLGRPAGAAAIALVALAPLAYDQVLRLAGQYRTSPTDLFAAGGRAAVWKTTFDIFRDHPLAGTGLAGFAATLPRYRGTDVAVRWEEAHNDFVQLLAETGLIGAAIAACVLAGALKTARGSFARQAFEPERPIRTGLALGCGAFLLHETLDFGAQIPAVAFAFAAAAAGCLVRPLADIPRLLEARGFAARSLATRSLPVLAAIGALWGVIHPRDDSLRSLEEGRRLLIAADRRLAERAESSSGAQGPAPAAHDARLSLLRAVSENPAAAEGHLLLARLQRRAALFGLPDEIVPGVADVAAARLNVAAELDPFRPDLRLGLLREHAARGERTAALQEVRALSIHGGGPLWLSFPIIWSLVPDPDLIDRYIATPEGEISFTDFLRVIGKRTEAEERLRRLLSSGTPQAVPAYGSLAEMLMQEGRAEEAARLGERLLEGRGLERGAAAAVCGRLAQSYMKAGLGEPAMRRIRQALDLSSEDPILQQAAAEIYLACGLPEEAKNRYEFLLRGGAPEPFLQTRGKSLHAGLGRAYDRLRRRDAALREWREVSRLDPLDEEAKQRITALSHGL